MSYEEASEPLRSYIAPVIVVILFSSLVGMFFGFFGRERIVQYAPSLGRDLLSNITFSFVIIGIGLSCSILLYFLSSRGKGTVANVVVAFALIPFFLVFIVFFGETLVLALFHQFSGPVQAVLSLASIYLSIFSVVLLMTQTSEGATRNMVFILYGGIIGGFAGLIVPTVPLILMLAVISVYDLIMVRESRLSAIIQEDRLRKGTLKLYYESNDIEMGIGEFISYSMLPAHSIFYYDPLTYFIVVSLVLVGCTLNFAILSRTRLMAGIPVPVLIALLFVTLRVLATPV